MLSADDASVDAKRPAHHGSQLLRDAAKVENAIWPLFANPQTRCKRWSVCCTIYARRLRLTVRVLFDWEVGCGFWLFSYDVRLNYRRNIGTED